jgi:3-phenylpropionate/trans-cinnamate dioxygenase ferredoxin subunit
MAVKMEHYVDVAGADEFRNGQMKGFEVEGKKILIAYANNNFYAASNVCPHLRGTLSEGQLAGTLVTCPRHYSQFDLKDGHVIRWTQFSGLTRTLNNVVRPPRPLQVYPVRVENNRIMVNLGPGEEE